jgi:hypothetical protein
MMDTTRKIEQIAAINQEVINNDDFKENHLVIIARCNDGTVWQITPDDYHASWHQLPDIPQPDVKGDAK